MTDVYDRFVTSLRDAGYSVTAARKAVFTALMSEEPLSMHQLIAKTAPAINRSSVYRTSALFEQLGVVVRLQTGWKYRLELSEAYSTHHHHVTCAQCGETTPIVENEILEHNINRLATMAGYRPLAHQLEIRGLCAGCAGVTSPVTTA